jgi:integrase/recombinase XerD
VRRTIADYLLAVTNYLRLGKRPDDLITVAEIEAQANRWAKRPSRRARNARTLETRRRFILYATHWLKFLGRWQPPPETPHSCADQLAAFADYMRRERNLSPKTVASRCLIVQEFIDRLCSSRSLQEVTPAHVDDALLDKLRLGKYCRTSVRVYAFALRAFFRYSETQGWCRRGLAASIQAPRVFSHDTLPSGPSWDDVQRLLATTEGDSSVAIRDRAILLLLSVYGCRAGEVVHLCLQDLDWQGELIHFTRSKTSRRQTYPLVRTVGDAILRYLREVRPQSSRHEVFLRLNAPFWPLTPGALWQVVSHRLRTLGLSLHHYGPHTLRHACATHLLEQGFSLKQIGDHLGHRHPDTTRLYAKVDLNGLRQVADFNLGDLP